MHAVAARDLMAEAKVVTHSVEKDPLEIFRALSGETLPVLLQSARRDPRAGRFSLVASDPFMVLRFREGRGVLSSRSREEVFDGDPFAVLQEALDRCRIAPLPGIPFAGGAIGYLGYGLRCWTEARAIHATLPGRWPDMHLAFYDRAFVVDHVLKCTHLVVTGLPETGPSRRREKLRGDLRRLQRHYETRPEREQEAHDPHPQEPEFATSKEQYLRNILRAQEYLAAGDIYQVNLSHKIRMEGNWRPLALYQGLLASHPACFAAYLPLRDHTVLCASPERLVRLTGRRAETSPIKGTRARASSPELDRQAALALTEGVKERAENVMIVDLARNDLGRVCLPGSVRAEEVCRVETLPSVHHLVSTVTGRLRPDAVPVDLVRALFPGGSMTGAPKIRAMEIIDELEGAERGIYSGSLGYFSFHGDLDLNIVIRTLILSGRGAELQVGGAILAESEPEAEYQETLDKARPLLGLLTGSRPLAGRS
ncbi:MAG: aminodeoxychorismate synthase component I [Acidobacteria bacterium]|nr:MAG: aminodeoxychorismate synthase component I [Acidobacteriota bacterium]